MPTDKNGAPAGSNWDSPHAGSPLILGDPALQPYVDGRTIPDDPRSHGAPRDPLQGDAVKQGTRAVYRQIPNVTIAHGWQIDQVRAALAAHNVGTFDASAQLTDSILGDDRVQATLGSRTSGLFGQKVKFKAADASPEAAACLDAWREAWPKLATTAALTTMHSYEIMMGFEPAQLLWDTGGEVWNPILEPWHPRFVYYNWDLFRFMALSSDGELPIVPGNGKWVLHARRGTGVNARPWIFGGVRPVAEPWMHRHWAMRDLSRYTEVHGMPIRKATVPAASDEVQRDRFQTQLENPGREMTLMVPKGVDGAGQDYDVELIEAEAGNWQAMIGLRDASDMAIVLALLFQNLTTEVTGGSFAATSAHGDIREQGIQADNEAWKLTIHEQIARPFAWLNFGDADLAPWTWWDVKPVKEWAMRAQMLAQFANAIDALRRGGVEFDAKQLQRVARSVGLSLPRLNITDPVQIAAAGVSGAKVGGE
jgi:phage gp29-like protein